MKLVNRGEAPKQQTRSIALTSSTVEGSNSAFVQPWDTRNLPKGSGPRETLTSAVIAAVAADTADINSFPARVTEVGTGRDLPNDPLAYAFNVSPRTGMSAADLRAHIVYQLEYTGECYVVWVNNTLTPLLAASVDIIPAAKGQHNRDGSPALIAGYIVRNAAGREIGRYNAEGVPSVGSAEGQLIRIAHPYPGNPYRSDAPVARAGLAIDTLSYARQASAFALRNSGQPAGLVQITDPSVDEGSIEAFDRRLNSRLSDVSQRGRVLVVSSGVDYKSLSTGNPADGIKDLTEMARRDVLSVWSMPESRLGTGGGRTYENQRVETANYLRNTIAHRLGLIASAVNQVARARGVVIEFELNAPELGEQDAEVTSRAKELFLAGIISQDEARELVGYGPTADGGNFANSKSQGAQPSRDSGPFLVAPNGADTTEVREVRSFDDEWVSGYASMVDATEDVLADAAHQFHVRAYREVSRKLNAVARTFERNEDAMKLTPEQLFNVTQADAYLVDEIAPLIEEAVMQAGQFSTKTLGIDPAKSVARWEQIAARRVSRLIKGVDANGVEVGKGWSRQMAVDIGEALNNGYAAGESTGSIAARIADRLGVDTSSFKSVGERALTIARTEANGLANETSIDAMRNSGVVSAKRWYTVGGARTRESHAAAGGQEVPLSGKFTVGGVQMDHPHDPSAPAREVVNCRCRMIPVVSADFGS